jgi:phospholipid/cholesterol/gamma-HCH transport system substrate-binding protein
MAVVAIFAAVWGYKFLKGQNFLSNDAHFHAFYDYADQLNESAPVFLKGLEVGTVTKVQFNAAAEKPIRVDFEVKNEIDVHPNTIAYIVSTGVLGGKAVQLSIPGPCLEDECLNSGAELEGRNKSLISSMIGEEDLETSINQLTSAFKTLIDSLDMALSQPEAESGIGRMAYDLQETLKNVENMTRSMDQMFSSPTSPVNKSLKNIESITRNLDQNNAKINQILNDLSTITEKVAELELETTLAKVNSTLDQSEGTIRELNDRLIQAKSALGSVESMLGQIESGDGTLGKLINSEELYSEMNKAVMNLNFLLQDIRLNPDRYIKVSVFGKKANDYTYPEEDPAFQD